MASYDLNFSGRQKRTMKVTFPDDKVIHCLPPKKGTMEAITSLAGKFGALNDITSEEAIKHALGFIGEVYDNVAIALSHNTECEEIDSGYLAEELDFSDIMEVLNAYMEFANDYGEDIKKK